MTPLDLPDARPHAVAGQPTTDEHDEAPMPRNAVPTERERLDVELELVALGDRSSHR
jgi:hypothetical protein